MEMVVKFCGKIIVVRNSINFQSIYFCTARHYNNHISSNKNITDKINEQISLAKNNNNKKKLQTGNENITLHVHSTGLWSSGRRKGQRKKDMSLKSPGAQL